MLPANLQLDNPLWDYALTVYPKLSEPLLALQNRGARVNQLLAALWCSVQGRSWPGSVDSAIEEWHQQQVLPIRQRRMALKPELEAYPELQSLYQAYKTTELNLERIELAMLSAWIQNSDLSVPASAEANIDAVLRGNGVDLGTPERQQLLDRLSAL